MIDFKTGVLNLNIKCPYCGCDYVKLLEEQISPSHCFLISCYNCCTQATIYLSYNHENTQMIIIKWDEMEEENQIK